MILYEWSTRDSDHLETADFEQSTCGLVARNSAPADFRALRGLVMATLGRLGRAQIGDHATRVVGRARNGNK